MAGNFRSPEQCYPSVRHRVVPSIYYSEKQNDVRFRCPKVSQQRRYICLNVNARQNPDYDADIIWSSLQSKQAFSKVRLERFSHSFCIFLYPHSCEMAYFDPWCRTDVLDWYRPSFCATFNTQVYGGWLWSREHRCRGFREIIIFQLLGPISRSDCFRPNFWVAG